MSDHVESSRIAEVYKKRDQQSSSAYSWLARDIHSTIFSVDYAMAEVLKACGITDLSDIRILDVGCGRGRWLRVLNEWGAQASNLFGVEINPDRLDYACSISPLMTFRSSAEGKFPFSNMKFDVVTVKTVFSSILDKTLRMELAHDIRSVVAEKGVVVVFDFRVSSPGNKDTVGIGHRAIQQMFPGSDISIRSVVLAPPLMRVLCKASPSLAIFVEWLCPFLRTHRIYTIKAV